MKKEGRMAHKGYMQGDMSPVVEDYQPKSSAYFDKEPNKTTEYIERRDRIEAAQASEVKKQEYKGRYD